MAFFYQMKAIISWNNILQTAGQTNKTFFSKYSALIVFYLIIHFTFNNKLINCLKTTKRV